MKTIGIIGAFAEAIERIMEKTSIVTIKNVLGFDFVLAKLGGNSIVFVKSGYGKVNAALCTQVMIDMFAVDYIINAGIGSGIEKNMNIGDIFISEDAICHDVDYTGFEYKKGEILGMSESVFKADEVLIELAKKASDSIEREHNTYCGRIATGDQFISKSEQRDSIASGFKAICIDMAGGAIAQTCYLNKIPFVIIKAISDRADENAIEDFKSFDGNKIDVLCEIVGDLAENM